VFDFGEWKGTVASRKNDDGTTTVVPVDPGVGIRVDFVVADLGSERRLILRDPQHERTRPASPRRRRMTQEEYLSFERASDVCGARPTDGRHPQSGGATPLWPAFLR
jgi:hypothetical protein